MNSSEFLCNLPIRYMHLLLSLCSFLYVYANVTTMSSWNAKTFNRISKEYIKVIFMSTSNELDYIDLSLRVKIAKYTVTKKTVHMFWAFTLAAW